MMVNISKPPTHGPQKGKPEEDSLETALKKLPTDFLKNLEKSTGSKEFSDLYKKGFSSKDLGEKTEKALFSLVRALMGLPVDEQNRATHLSLSASSQSQDTEGLPKGSDNGLTDVNLLSTQSGISAGLLATAAQPKMEEPLPILEKPIGLDQPALQAPASKGLKDTAILNSQKESLSGTLTGVENVSAKQMPPMDASNDRSVSSSAASQVRTDALKAEIQSLMNKLLTFVTGHADGNKGLHQLRIPLPNGLSAPGNSMVKSAEMLVQLEGKEIRIQFKGATSEAQQWLQPRLAELQLRPGLREFQVQVQWAAPVNAVFTDNTSNSLLSQQTHSRALPDAMADPHQFQDERKQKNPYDEEDESESEDEQ